MCEYSRWKLEQGGPGDLVQLAMIWSSEVQPMVERKRKSYKLDPQPHPTPSSSHHPHLKVLASRALRASGPSEIT